MVIGVPKETWPGENRVALVPSALGALSKAKLEVVIEAGAGQAAGFPDDAYAAAGARIGSRADVLAADVILAIRGITDLRAGQTLVAMVDPLSEPAIVAEMAPTGATVFALELVPRITRAQAMDVLSSQANLAGYKAVLLGAAELPKIMPMMTTAAGTIPPARAFIIGAGVAGLQAIATAKRLGAVVHAYDVRPEVKQQIESLGAKFVELPLETASGEGGYAKAMDEEFYAKQRDLMARTLAESDLVVTTAAIPGRKAPILITTSMVEGMRPGSVIVDIAAERGGNCELTQAGATIDHHGVKILGPVNVPATLAHHASTLYAKNVVTFLLLSIKDGALNINREDPIIAESILTHGGAVVNARVNELLGVTA